MKVFGEQYRGCCPVCHGTDIVRGYWRIPMMQSDERPKVRGVCISHLVTLDATERFDWDRCVTCESVYMNPLMGFQGHSEAFGRQAVTDEKDMHPYRKRYELIQPWLPGSGVVADVACGSGLLLQLVASEAIEWEGLIGLDCCRAYVEHLRQLGFEAHCIDLTTESPTPYLHGCAFIIFSEAFEHMRSPYAVMAGLVESLRPGGRLFFSAQSLGGTLPIRPSETVYVTLHGLQHLCGLLGVVSLFHMEQCGRHIMVVEKP